VKGRIAKTVEEKVSEYRQEKELRRSVVRLADSGEDLRRENGDSDVDAFSSLPHSLSESLLSERLESEADTSAAATTPSTTPPQPGFMSSRDRFYETAHRPKRFTTNLE
jgi:hypothetical protein